MSLDRLAGTWKLISSEMRDSSGGVHYPLGADCAGLLTIDRAGTMAAQLMRQGRRPFGSGDILLGTDAEVQEAYHGYVAFWGQCTVDAAKGQVTYVVTGSLFPNWIGHENLRFYTIVGDSLTLRTPTFLMDGNEITGVLVWQRAA
jgi:hypothetical protein